MSPVLDTNGIQIYFETHGDGEPLLFLHGFLGSGDTWQYIFQAAPEGHRLIAPDLRGHGASTNPSNAFTFRQASDDVFSLLDHLGVDRVKAIGVSAPHRPSSHAPNSRSAIRDVNSLLL